MTVAKAVESSLLGDVRREAFAEATHFRSAFYACLTRRGDELFELCDALLCSDVWSTWRLRLNTVVGTARCTAGSTVAASTSHGCEGRWPDCGGLGPQTGAWYSRRMSARGCGRTRTPPQTARSATPTGEARTSIG